MPTTFTRSHPCPTTSARSSWFSARRCGTRTSRSSPMPPSRTSSSAPGPASLRAGSGGRRQPRRRIAALHRPGHRRDGPGGRSMEARGGIGRCYKEMFLSCTEPARRQRYLTRSLDAYLTAYQENSAHTWHGINAVALLARARRDGIALPRECRRPPRWPTRSCGPSTRPGAGHVDRGDGVRGGDRTRPVRRGRRTRGGVHRDDATRDSRSRRSSASSRRSGSSPPSSSPGDELLPRPSRGAAPVSTGAKSRWSPRTSAPHALPSSTTRTAREDLRSPTASCR